MLYRQLLSHLPEAGDFQFLSAPGCKLNYREFAGLVEHYSKQLQNYSGKKIGLYLHDGPLLVALLFALDKLGCDAFLFGAENQAQLVESSMQELVLFLCITDRAELGEKAQFLVLGSDDQLGTRVPPFTTSQAPFSEGERLVVVDVNPPIINCAPVADKFSNSLSAQRSERGLTSSATGQARGDGESTETSKFGEPGRSQVVLFTSGTSGKPKGALHTWDSLAAGIKVDSRFEQSRWLLTYGLTRFAGIQVFLQAFLNKGCLIFQDTSHPGELIKTLVHERVEYLSGTPTFWRKLLAMAGPEQLQSVTLKQITLGGEIVGQGILNALRAAFPTAQLTHIYASTEMGVCFAVRDGLEGFPLSYLQQNPDVQMEIRDGELFIRSRRAMKTYLSVGAPRSDDWFATGDLVEVREDRVYFLGRRSEIINVGGNKVYPEEVEEQVRRVPGVREVRVFGTKSSFAGSLVSAEVVPAEGAETAALKQAILEHCNAVLPTHKRPRLIQFVEQLKETASKKLARQ